MKLDNSELKLIVDIFCDMRKDVQINIHGRVFFDLLGSGERKKISLENNKIILYIQRGRMTVVDEYDIIKTLTTIDPTLMKTTLEDFLWCNCVEFNNITINDYPETKAGFFNQLLQEYMDYKKCKCFDIYTSIDYRVYNLMYFRDGTLYREYMDFETDPTTPLLLIFDTTIEDFIKRVPTLRFLGVSTNYEVSKKENYLKQLARISRKVKFKFKIVGGR